MDYSGVNGTYEKIEEEIAHLAGLKNNIDNIIDSDVTSTDQLKQKIEKVNTDIERAKISIDGIVNSMKAVEKDVIG